MPRRARSARPPPSASSSSPSIALKRVCTVRPVLRFIPITSIYDIVKIAHVSDTFRDALENYSPTVWRRVASTLEDKSSDDDDVDDDDDDDDDASSSEDASSNSEDIEDASPNGDESSSRHNSVLDSFFKHNAFAWIARKFLTVGQLDVSVMKGHPLIVAAKAGAADVVRVCLTADPACVDVRDSDDASALHGAAGYGHVDCVRELLAADVDITVADDNRNTALHAAAAGGCVDVVRLLVAHAGVEEIRDRRNILGKTALHVASRFWAECVRALLAADVDITVTDDDGSWTALHCAAEEGKADVVQLLASHPDFSQVRDERTMQGDTALIVASLYGHTECVRELLAAGADTTIADTSGRTALHNAAGRGHADVVQVLVAHADVGRIRDKRDSQGKTAIDVATTKEIKRMILSIR